MKKTQKDIQAEIIEQLKEENEKLRKEIHEYSEIQEQNQGQSAELEIQNEELISTRYELELQNEELKRSQSEIEQLLNKFNMLFNFAPVGFLLISENYIIIDSNKIAAEFLNIPQRELIGKEISEVLHSSFKTFLDISIRKSQISVPTNIVINNNEESRHLRIDFRILENIIGTEKFILISLTDITMLQVIHQQLEESEEKFRSIFEQTPVGIYRTTPEGNFLLANPKLISMLGYSSFEDLHSINLEVEGYPLQEPRSIFKDKIEKLGEIIGEINVWSRKDGSKIIVRESSKIVRDGKGKIKYYEGVIEDITEEEKLKETLNAIIRSLPDLLIIFDEEGYYLDIYTSNDSLLYAPREELLGKQINEIFSKELSSFFQKTIHSAIQGSKPIIINYELDVLGGKKFFEAIVTPIKIDAISDKQKVIFLARDITERKKIEIELVNANYEKDLFFSIIGYDLRDPITSLVTYADIFINYFDKLDKEQIKNYTMKVSEEIYTLKNLIENLLDWSKSQSGKLEYLPEVTDLYNLVENVILIYNNILKSKNLAIISSVQPQTYCNIDRFMISSVLRNLISNAIKFSHPNSSIEIFTENIDHYVKIYVKDYGIGIPAEKLETLFDEDSNAFMNSLKIRKQGLGLNISKNFIQKHNCIIGVQSEVGKGSTFFFTVPKVDTSKLSN